jgi:GTP pyrophosphokinase
MESKPLRKSKKNHLELPLEHYSGILSRYFPEKGEEENKILFEALAYAYKHHAGYFRKSGEPYLNHPVAVAESLIRDLSIKDPLLISAALLHDVVEDVASVTIRDIESIFGTTVANLVDGCTKLQLQQKDRAVQSDLTHSKIFLSASRQLGVLLIKLADRLHNMQTLSSLPESKRRRIALETLRVYAPIAAKLNLYAIKRNLYNLALSYLFPRKSKKIHNITKELFLSEEVKNIHETLCHILSLSPHEYSLRPRTKGLCSFYSHLRQTIDINNAENMVDFTIVLHTDDPIACYVILGEINRHLKPIPKSIRDYIANQKPNGYQSLHVRINQGGRDYLIKIRTREMDLLSNSGLRYQWNAIHLQESYWGEISDLLRNIGEYGGASSQRKNLIQMAYSAEVFVYTPKGDIHYLPRGSIVLDFAYKIHSDLGDYCDGAEISGRRVSPTTRLNDGDTVKIIQSEELLDVDSDLEKLCMTPKARSAVNKLLQKRRQSAAKKIGREILFQEIIRHGLSPELLKEETMSLILNIHHIKDFSQMYVRIGQDILSSKLILYYFDQFSDIKPEFRSRKEATETRNTLIVSDIEKAVHKFSKCCKPFPGQSGVVASLSERGVAFHLESCRNLMDANSSGSQQILNVTWDLETKWPFPMVFNLRAKGISLQEFIRLISPITFQFQLHRLEKGPARRTGPSVFVTISIQSFKEAVSFFQCFAPGSVSVRSFSRKDQTESFSA